ncbi:tyrosine-type recombinase/integrase [Mycobacterium riyadhense]|uniref:tyrosine-type recombinase/integrase n=1 Tax=Mycobacterium riyadhense TaxID=486698 RepID=UPI001951C861
MPPIGAAACPGWLAPGSRRCRAARSGRRGRCRRSPTGSSFVADLLAEALAHTGLTDPATGASLHFAPHDFRRMFITDAVLNGLPPHIAQVIAGHRDIGVTMGYKAVYPDEAITAHLAFIARRRALRPTEEYRQPTEEEWQQFLGRPRNCCHSSSVGCRYSSVGRNARRRAMKARCAVMASSG